MKFARSICTHLVVAAALVALVLMEFGSEPPRAPVGFLPPGQLVSHADGRQKRQVVVNLKLRRQAELQQLLRDQSDPGSPRYRKYLTPQEFTARFAPGAQDCALVADYLRSCGMSEVAVADNRLMVVARGSLAQLEAAFGVVINCYRDRRQQKVYFSNSSPPLIPAGLEDVVESVVGLDNSNSVLQSGRNLLPDELPEARQAGLPPAGMSPQTIATAYNFPNANNSRPGNKYSGAGRCLAIATAFTYDPSDVKEYWERFGIKRSGQVVDIPVGGVTTVTHKETTLDLQQAGAQVPGADILMYMGVDGDSTTFELVFNQIVIDNRADVVSMSWGVCEDALGSKYMNPLNAILLQARAQGIVVFCSSGDRGAYDYDATSTKMAAHYLASDPNVVGVGGTTLIVSGQPSRREAAWSGSGGGVSAYWKQPDWQHGPGVPVNGRRNTPDVALNANPFRSGYAAYFRGRWLVTGGTSLATPNWAALWLLADEAAGSRLGDANQKLYLIGRTPELYARLFVDIVQGNNGDERGPGYKALPGWDHATGWGVPNGAALVEWLKQESAVTAPSPAPTPAPGSSPTAAPAPEAGTATQASEPTATSPPVLPVVPSPQPSP